MALHSAWTRSDAPCGSSDERLREVVNRANVAAKALVRDLGPLVVPR